MEQRKITLREIDREDVERINQWRADEEVVQLLASNQRHISLSVEEAWFENYLTNREHTLRLAILEKKSGKHIGCVSLTNMHPVNRTAEFSIIIGDKQCWSKGYGSEASVLMVTHGFKDLNLNRIYLYVLESNSRAISLYEKVGFVREGMMRQAVYKQGRFVDLILMAILRDVWNQRQKK